MRNAFSFMHLRGFAALILAVIGGSTIPALAYGWVTAEHIRIGEASYHQACAYFRRPDVVRTGEQRLRAARFCFQDATWARHYGELTAYGGDYTAKPEDIPTDFAQMSARLRGVIGLVQGGEFVAPSPPRPQRRHAFSTVRAGAMVAVSPSCSGTRLASPT